MTNIPSSHGGEQALQSATIQNLFKYQSGRVIALGRVMLAALFLLAIWLDRSQPARSPAQTYGMLVAYLLFAVILTAATWRNWWLDARLAAPVHLIDTAVFTIIVFSTNGYTSPFFLFFALPLLSAAIRWGWRETAATALALTVLYLVAGSLVAGSQSFEVQRFVTRAGHLLILSALLIWFGLHQGFARLSFSPDDIDQRSDGRDDPFALALRFAMEASGARLGFVLVPQGANFSALRLGAGGERRIELPGPLLADPGHDAVWLFDCPHKRAMTRSVQGRRFTRAQTVFNVGIAERLELSEGLVAQVSTSSGDCCIVLEQIDELSSDYVELGRELIRAVRAIVQQVALVDATAEGAAARARLTLARDVHDGIVQFLAGATFRLEAIARSARGGADVDCDLRELKDLMVDEQRDIRGFITALRRDRELALPDAVEELAALAARLGQHWSVKCKVTGRGEQVPIPIRLHLDLHQLLREAVANAVRHGGATKVEVTLKVEGDQLRFDVRDNGTGFAGGGEAAPVQPWSLRERVDRAGGSLFLVSQPGRTDVSIVLPLEGVPA